MQAKKSLGQHWLEDEPTLNAICEAAAVNPGETVLEIGPGKGSLTASLLGRGAKVAAVEVDKDLCANLREKFKDDDFILNELSILKFDFSSMPANYKIVANIPYYLTNHLLRLLAETPSKPIVAALLVQKEVAERVAARPGQMATLSVLVQLFYEVELGNLVPAKLFKPPPKVDSQILVIKARTKPLIEVDYKTFMHIVSAGFSEKRKKLRSSLAGGLSISKPEAETLLETAGIDPNSRAQELSLVEWQEIYTSYSRPNSR